MPSAHLRSRRDQCHQIQSLRRQIGMAAEEEGGPVVQPPAAGEGFKPVVASRAFWESLKQAGSWSVSLSYRDLKHTQSPGTLSLKRSIAYNELLNVALLNYRLHLINPRPGDAIT